MTLTFCKLGVQIFLHTHLIDFHLIQLEADRNITLLLGRSIILLISSPLLNNSLLVGDPTSTRD